MKSFISVIFLFFLLSLRIYSQNKPKVIEINLQCEEVTDLLDLFEVEKIVHLATQQAALIRNVRRLKSRNDTIFIFDGRQCLVFDPNGKYINTIGIPGRGPGELISPCDYGIHVDNNLLAFLDNRTTKIVIYDINGKHLTDKYPKLEYCGHLEWVTPDEFIITTYIRQNAGYFSNRSDEFKNSCVYYYDSKNKIVKEILRFPDNPVVLKIENWNNFYTYENRTYFRNPISNNVYRFEGANKMIQAFQIDFGKYNIPEESNQSNSKPATVLAEVQRGELVMLFCFLEVKDFYYLVYKNSDDTFIHLISKNTGLQYRHNIKNKVDPLRFCAPLFYEEGALIGTLEPSRFLSIYDYAKTWDISKEKKQVYDSIASSLNPEDNPALLYLKPKSNFSIPK